MAKVTLSPWNWFFSRPEVRFLWSEHKDSVIVVGLALVAAFFVVVLEAKTASHEEDGHDEHAGHSEHGEPESRIVVDEAGLVASGVKLLQAESARVIRRLRVNGVISVDRDRTVTIAPRFSGIVVKALKNLGDVVGKGETLALMEHAMSRAQFEVKTGVAGTIVERRAVSGSFASEREPLFTVVDLTSVWVEMNVPEMEHGRVQQGQTIIVKDVTGTIRGEGKISYVSAEVLPETQALLVRAALPNPGGIWRPGSFVEGEIITSETLAAVAVSPDAIQLLDDKPFVFVQTKKNEFEMRPVHLGETGTDWIEIKDGMTKGLTYAAVGSFILKSELLKSTAAHEH